MVTLNTSAECWNFKTSKICVFIPKKIYTDFMKRQLIKNTSTILENAENVHRDDQAFDGIALRP